VRTEGATLYPLTHSRRIRRYNRRTAQYRRGPPPQSAGRAVQARTAVTKHPICAQVAGGRVSKEMHALLPRHVTASPAVTAGRRVCSTMLIEGRGDHLQVMIPYRINQAV